MSIVYFGLGSNQGDRRQNLNCALFELSLLCLKKIEVSPIYETKALLPDNALVEWNLPYLNLVAKAELDIEPHLLLSKTHSIEQKLGREKASKWSPRVIDIDILYYDNLAFKSQDLSIPHPEIEKRAFVLDPLKDLNAQSFLKLARAHKEHQPAWMGILNITPDSFSDGGVYNSNSAVTEYLNKNEHSTAYLDIGAESTRPGAQTLSAEDEWQRLRPIFELLKEKYSTDLCRPCLSLDTYHGETAALAVENYNIKIINDVSGLSCAKMKEFLSTFKGSYVLMHSLTVPSDPQKTLSINEPVMEQLLQWFDQKIEVLLKLGLSANQIILDPGLGFGKTKTQNIEIIQKIEELQKLNFRILVGHSRKSFMNYFAPQHSSQRDFESIGVSLDLALKGVDIIRVHNPFMHQRAWRGFSEVQ